VVVVVVVIVVAKKKYEKILSTIFVLYFYASYLLESMMG